jgi:hypothetical protein
VKGYYDNFVRVVLDAVSGEQDVKIIKSPGRTVCSSNLENFANGL